MWTEYSRKKIQNCVSCILNSLEELFKLNFYFYPTLTVCKTKMVKQTKTPNGNTIIVCYSILKKNDLHSTSKLR